MQETKYTRQIYKRTDKYARWLVRTKFQRKMMFLIVQFHVFM